MGRMRADVCASDDYATRDRLFAAIYELGGAPEGDSEAVGVGLHRFLFPAGELTVFVDAWLVDVAGPDELVRDLLQLISSGDRG